MGAEIFFEANGQVVGLGDGRGRVERAMERDGQLPAHRLHAHVVRFDRQPVLPQEFCDGLLHLQLPGRLGADRGGGVAGRLDVGNDPGQGGHALPQKTEKKTEKILCKTGPLS